MSAPSFHFPDNNTPRRTDDFSIDPALFPESAHQKSASVAVPSQSVATAVSEAEGTLLFRASALFDRVQFILVVLSSQPRFCHRESVPAVQPEPRKAKVGRNLQCAVLHLPMRAHNSFSCRPGFKREEHEKTIVSTTFFFTISVTDFSTFYSYSLNVTALKNLCRERKLKVGGKKGELIERLEQQDQKCLPKPR